MSKTFEITITNEQVRVSPKPLNNLEFIPILCAGIYAICNKLDIPIELVAHILAHANNREIPTDKNHNQII